MARILFQIVFGALLCVIGLTSAANAANRHALVIGIDRYDNLGPDKQLRKAVNDARTVAGVLRGLGFRVSYADNVSRRDFNRLWARFLNRLQPGDVAAVYFSGHGVEIGGQNYLIPRDVPKLGDGEAELLKAEAISFDSLLNGLNRKRPRVTLIILDACRNNPFADSRGRAIGAARGLGRVEPPEGTFVMYSAGAGQTALDRLSDHDPNPNSVYTRILLPLLKTPGLDLTDIARQLRLKVRDIALRVNHRQTPAYYDQMIGRFCPAGCKSRDITVAPAQQPRQMVERMDRAARNWMAIQNTKSCAVLQTFIKRHASSDYADYARARRKELGCRRKTAGLRPGFSATEPLIRTTVIRAGIRSDQGFVPVYYARLAVKIENLTDREIGVAVFNHGQGATFTGTGGERCDDANRSDAVTGLASMWNRSRRPITHATAGGTATRIAPRSHIVAHVSLECSGRFHSRTGSLSIPAYVVLPDRILVKTISVPNVRVR